DVVEALQQSFMEKEALREALKSVYDLERLAGRISFGNVNARDLIQLKQSLQEIPNIKNVLANCNQEEITRINNKIEYPEALVDLLEYCIEDNKPIAIYEGSNIKTGYQDKLYEYIVAHDMKL